MELPPTSRLAAGDIEWLERFLRDRPLFRLYFEAALADLARGVDNRVAYVGEARSGAILGIHFDHLAVFTALGQLDDHELRMMLETDGPAEVHVEPVHEPRLLPLCAHRLLKVSAQRVYSRSTAGAGAETAVRQLGPSDAAAVSAFLRRHYPRSVFSDWMLALPFVALEENGEIVATGGTIAIQNDRAVIGNFLTHPDHRRRGAARRLARHLAALLGQLGVRTVLLVTTDDNPAAWRAYEAAGFGIIDRRRQIDLAATENETKGR